MNNRFAKVVSDAYNYNDYNLKCRGTNILDADRKFIESGIGLARVNNLCKDKLKILELGCGNGSMYTRELAKYGKVVGCDISERQIGCARLNVPSARFICKDVTDLSLRYKYDVVAMFHSFFNIPFEIQENVLFDMGVWLSSNGVILITTYGDETYEKVSCYFYGRPMIWNHLSPDDFRFKVEAVNLRVVDCVKRNDAIYSGPTYLWTIKHNK